MGARADTGPADATVAVPHLAGVVSGACDNSFFRSRMYISTAVLGSMASSSSVTFDSREPTDCGDPIL